MVQVEAERSAIPATARVAFERRSLGRACYRRDHDAHPMADVAGSQRNLARSRARQEPACLPAAVHALPRVVERPSADSTIVRAGRRASFR